MLRYFLRLLDVIYSAWARDYGYQTRTLNCIYFLSVNIYSLLEGPRMIIIIISTFCFLRVCVTVVLHQRSQGLDPANEGKNYEATFLRTNSGSFPAFRIELIQIQVNEVRTYRTTFAYIIAFSCIVRNALLVWRWEDCCGQYSKISRARGSWLTSELA